MRGQLEKATQPSVTGVEVDWQQFNDDVTQRPTQAPANIMAVFSGSRQVVYGFVPNCTQVSVVSFYCTSWSRFSNDLKIILGFS